MASQCMYMHRRLQGNWERPSPHRHFRTDAYRCPLFRTTPNLIQAWPARFMSMRAAGGHRTNSACRKGEQRTKSGDSIPRVPVGHRKSGYTVRLPNRLDNSTVHAVDLVPSSSILRLHRKAARQTVGVSLAAHRPCCSDRSRDCCR